MVEGAQAEAEDAETVAEGRALILTLTPEEPVP